MVIPETIYPESNNNHNIKKNNDQQQEEKLQKTNIKQTAFRPAEEIATSTNDNLNYTNVSMEMIVDGVAKTTTAATAIMAVPLKYFFNTLHRANDANNDNNKYRDINFELWTQQYGGAEGNLNAIHLDTYFSLNGTFDKNAQLYPNKLWNLQQRTMRIGSLTYVPYVKTYYVVSSFFFPENQNPNENKLENTNYMH